MYINRWYSPYGSCGSSTGVASVLDRPTPPDTPVSLVEYQSSGALFQQPQVPSLPLPAHCDYTSRAPLYEKDPQYTYQRNNEPIEQIEQIDEQYYDAQAYLMPTAVVERPADSNPGLDDDPDNEEYNTNVDSPAAFHNPDVPPPKATSSPVRSEPEPSPEMVPDQESREIVATDEATGSSWFQNIFEEPGSDEEHC